MTHGLSTVKKLTIGAVAAGSLALSAAGVAAAAPAGAAPTVAAHFNCAKAPKALARIQGMEARIASRLTKLNAAETKALQKGNTKRVDRIKQRIAALESSPRQARLDKRKAGIEAKCHVNVPAAGSSTTGSSGDIGNSTVTASTTV